MTDNPTDHLNDDGVTRDDVKYSVLTGVGVVGMMTGFGVAVAGNAAPFLTSMGWMVVGLLMILASSNLAMRSVAKMGDDQ